MESFRKWVKDQPDYGLCPPPLNAQKALQFLTEYILGEDWYVVMPLSVEQCNTEIVHAILEKCSKKYRKELREEKTK